MSHIQQHTPGKIEIIREDEESSSRAEAGEEEIIYDKDNYNKIPKETNSPLEALFPIYNLDDIKKFTNDFSEVISESEETIKFKGTVFKQLVVVMKYKFPVNNEVILKIVELAKYDHPNVLKVMGICEKPEFYIIYEYMPRGSLQDYVNHKEPYINDFSKKMILQIFLDLSSALHFLHQNGICHYNINPTTILFDEYNKPKFSGFNLANPKEQDEKSHKAFIERIHPDYFDPVLKDKDKFGTFTDIYCFGLMLFIALSRKNSPDLLINVGKEIFENKDDNAIKVLFIHDWNNEVAMKLLSCILECIDEEEERRLTADQLVDLLKNILDNCELE